MTGAAGGDRSLRPSLHFNAFSPAHGSPQDGKVTDVNYVPYVTKDMVTRADAAGMQVIPSTVDGKPTIRALVGTGSMD